MSMGEEIGMEMLIEQEVEDLMARGYTKWKTLDGRILDIKSMDTEHIKNCVAILERNHKIVPTLMYKVLEVRSMIK